MRSKTAVCVVVLCSFCTAAQAIPTITAGNWTIQNTANQSTDPITALPIAIMVSGISPADDPQGVDLALNAGPVGIQAVDLIGPGTNPISFR